MKDKIKAAAHHSIFRFVIIGCCTTTIDFIIYMGLSLVLDITVSKAISMLAASIFSYCANKIFTFANKEKTSLGKLVKFYLVFAANMAANLSANALVYKLTGQKLVAFVVATGCGMTVNYLGQRFVVFGEGKEGDARGH